MPGETDNAAGTALRVNRGTSVALVIGLLGVVASVMAWRVVAETEKQRIRTEFASRAEDLAEAVKDRVRESLFRLESIEAFFNGSQNVERLEFAQFVQPMLLRSRSVQAFEWAPRVMLGEREDFEAAAREEGFSEFRITGRSSSGQAEPRPETPDYYPVFFVEPFKGNEPAIGFDLASDTIRRNALSRARDTGLVSATESVDLVQKNDKGVLVFRPIYRAGAFLENSEERRTHLEGFAVGVIRIKDLFSAAVGNLARKGLELTAVDTTATEERARLLFQSAKTAGPSLDHPPGEFEYRQIIDMAGRPWVVQILPGKRFVSERQTFFPLAILVGGVAMSLLLTSYLLLRQKAVRELILLNETLEERVVDRTRELEESKSTLEKHAGELETVNREIEKTNSKLARFNRLAVGREKRMIELKEEINTLCRKHDEPDAYDLTFTEEDPPTTVWKMQDR